MECDEDEECYAADSVQDDCGGQLIAVEKARFGPDPSDVRAVVGKEQQRKMEKERRARYDKGYYSNHGEPTLVSLWRDLTMALRDCTKRIPSRKGCI
jgi:hypothetical protein